MKLNFNPAPEGYLSALREHRSKNSRRLKFCVALVTVFSIITIYGGKAVDTTLVLAQESENDDYYDYIAEEGCNVLGLTLYGGIGTYDDYTSSNDIRTALEEYASHENIEAILVEVDSGGGSAVAGDEILHLLDEQIIPVVAHIRNMGASAAYMAILSADRIFTHPYGSVGSIGVMNTFFDYSEYNEKEGIKYVPVLSSPSKDSGTQDRTMTEQERQMYQSEVDYIYDGFVNSVAKYRNLTKEQVLKLADGNTYLGAAAKAAGLVDEVGGFKEVRNYIENLIDEPVKVCWEN